MKTAFIILIFQSLNLFGKPLDPAGTRQEVGGIGALLAMEQTQPDNSVKTYQNIFILSGNLSTGDQWLNQYLRDIIPKDELFDIKGFDVKW